MGMIATILLEPHTLLREGLLRILEKTPFRVFRTASTLDEILNLPQNRPPKLIIVAIDRNTADAGYTVSELKIKFPAARIVVLAADLNVNEFKQALRAGANAYLIKSISAEALVKSLDLVLVDSVVIPSTVLLALAIGSEGDDTAPSLVPAERLNLASESEAARRLSVREAAILQCMVHGDSNKHIARRFDIAEATVKVHVKAILRKVGVRNRTQAAIWALNHLPSAPADMKAQLASLEAKASLNA
jgi:two-component system nitrate/nitrite response regulator NarL